MHVVGLLPYAGCPLPPVKALSVECAPRSRKQLTHRVLIESLPVVSVHMYEVSLLIDGSLTKPMLRSLLQGVVRVNKEIAYSLDSKAIVQCGLSVQIRFAVVQSLSL